MNKKVKNTTIEQLAEGINCHKNSLYCWLCRPELAKHCSKGSSAKRSEILYIHLTKDFINKFKRFLNSRRSGYMFLENFENFLKTV